MNPCLNKLQKREARNKYDVRGYLIRFRSINHSMDELDMKILRSLISERAVSPSNASVRLSLRGIAARLGADDTTVRYRYKKLQESDCILI